MASAASWQLRAIPLFFHPPVGILCPPMDQASLRKAALLMVGTLLLSLAFAGSYVGALHEPEPHGLQLAVVGLPAVAQRTAAALREQTGDALDVSTEPDRAAALDAIDRREVYGALIPGPERDRLLVASAAGDAAVQALEQVVGTAAARQGARLAVTDVRPLPADDARGLSSFYLAIGWVVAGYLGATAIGLTRGMAAAGRRLAALRIGALLVYSILSGILGAILINGVIGTLGGHGVALAALGTFVVFATALATTALETLLGIVGTGVVLLLFVVLGNPGSGGPYARELLPGLWRDTGAYLTPGAGTDGIRNVVYFGGNALTTPLLVLAAWAVVGAAVMLVLGRTRWTAQREIAGGALSAP